ncbi:MAG TPA: anti-sigma factor [Methylomirabilota bacterium]|nr:anti-sigma factor [Methylomirabilota bacterium]
MNHNEWLEQAEIYALGALDEEERARFEAHLAAGCSVCENRLRETGEALSLLPKSLEPLPPPPSVKARLLAQIGSRAAARTARVRQRTQWLPWGIGAGALVAASLLFMVGWNIIATRQEIQSLEGRVAQLRKDLAQREETVRLLFDPEVRLVQLSGLEPSPGAQARLFWNPVSRTGVLFTTGLPSIPSEKAYELWAIAGKEPLPAGVFTVEAGGRALFRLPPLPEGVSFDKFAVTVEPAGGVPKPTGPMVLLGTL